MAGPTTVVLRLRTPEVRQEVQTVQNRLLGRMKDRTAEKSRERVPVVTGELKESIGVTDEGVVATALHALNIQNQTGFLTTAGQETTAELADLVEDMRL